MIAWLANLFRKQIDHESEQTHVRRAQRELVEAQKRLDALEHELVAIERRQ